MDEYLKEFKENNTMRVSAKSDPSSLAGAIASVIRNNEKVVITAIGAGAVNQGLKATAIARGFVAAEGIDLVLTPSFQKKVINDADVTVMQMILNRR